VVTPGAEHRITVVVNNILSWQTIPPGYVTETPDGPRSVSSSTSSTTPG
jgi:beta-glucuronidase